MDKRETLTEMKALQKAVQALRKKLVKERNRLEKLDRQADSKREKLNNKLENTDDFDKRTEVIRQIDDLPDYTEPMGWIGELGDDYDQSMIGAVESMEKELDHIVKKGGMLDEYFAELVKAELPANERD